MKLEFDDELIIEGVARAAERLLSSEQFMERIVDAIILRFDALTPLEAAKFLDVTTRTLSENHIEWGLDKSVVLGASNPRYFLSQIIARLKTKIVAGRRSELRRLVA